MYHTQRHNNCLTNAIYLLYMIKKIFALFFLITIATQGQNFKNVDNMVLTYPKFSKVEDLTSRIKKDFTNDEEKVRAAFFWLAKNIRYDLKEFYNPTVRNYSFSYISEAEKLEKMQALKDQIINVAFKTKKGVCEEYAQSFKKICDLLDIKAAVIKGYVRSNSNEIGKPERNSNHAWNAVKLNNKWLILDATWAAGYEFNGKWVKKFNNYFYNIPKEKIFKTHFPEESIWVLRFGRITLEDFYKQPIYGEQLLASKAELISPKNGIITIEKGKNIELKFKNLEAASLVIYNFKGNRYAKKPLIKTEGNITTLSIVNPTANSELYVYIKGENALIFKTK